MLHWEINIYWVSDCVEYISPAYEKMGFELVRDYLVTMGYPQEIRDFDYDPSFPIR